MSGGGGNSVPESFDRAASEKRAGLVREQWQDYQTRFQPVENQIINEMGSGKNTTLNAGNVARAQAGTDTAYSNAAGSMNRDYQRYGQGMTQNQDQALMTNFNTNLAASKANATNQATLQDADMRQQVVGGGLGSISSAVK